MKEILAIYVMVWMTLGIITSIILGYYENNTKSNWLFLLWILLGLCIPFVAKIVGVL